MVRHTPAARKSLLFLPVLGLTASPAAQAASPLSLQLGDGWGDSNLGLGGELFASEATAVSSTQSLAPAMPIPERPIDAGESLRVEWADGGIALDPGAAIAEPPQLVAQVLPTPGATQTQVEFTPGSATFDISGGTQAGENLFHRFDQLDLSAGQVANFLSQPQTEAVFSQIGGEASSIDGLLKVSGSSADLFLINPNGIVFGPNARLDLSGSFTATTADRLGFGGPGGEQWIDLLGEGFTAQTAIASQASGGIAGSLDALEFSLDAAGGAIVNQGQLAVGDGQSLGLLGNAVVNTGSLTAPGGEVTVLAASGGQRVSLAGGLLNLEVGAAAAGLPRTMLSVEASQAVAEATGLKLNADGSVSLEGGMAIASGEVDVSSMSGAGGTARLLGDRVQVMGAVVDASGAGGGSVQVGGDYKGQGDLLRASTTQVDAASVLRADGIASTSDIRPDGGEVIVWSDGSTLFAGEATARGGAQGGNGGLVETSGQQQLVIAPTAKVSTAAPQGEMGEWLLDPADLTVIAVGGAAGIVGGTNDPVAASTIDRPTLEAALNGNNVNLQATNSISIDTPINTTANAAAGNLQLTTPTLNLNERIRLNGNLSGTATTVNVGANGGIQNGIDAVATGGTVNLAAATYREGQQVMINKSLTLQGQGTASTVISGDADGNGTGDHRVMWVTGASSNVALQQLAVADGSTVGAGGGLVTTAGSLAIADAEFRNNQVTNINQDGGAIHQMGGGVLMITRSSFINNRAAEDGGAIDLLNGSLQISDSTFSQNVSSRWAGAIDVEPNGILSIVNSDFNNNTAQLGGAIFNRGETTIDTTSFRFNNATTDGGAIYSDNAAAPLVIQGVSSFVSNQAGGNGGALFLNGTTQFLQGGIVSNTAGNDGGGIYNTGNLTLNNPNISQNTAVRGGGIANIGNASSITSTNFAIRDNTAADNGGGLFNDLGSLSFTSGSFDRNNSSQNGGGIWTSGPLTLRNIGVQDNSAVLGGGVFATNTNVDIQSFQFIGNSASVDGGGLRLANLNAIISMGDFINNQAQFGGGLEASGTGNIQIGNVTFDSNVATEEGGAFQNDGVVSTVINDSQFSNNQSTFNGGAIQNSGTLTVNRSSLLSNTTSRYGAGIRNDGILNVVGSTFSGGQSTSGSGVFNTSSLTVANSLFDGNVATRGITTGDGAAIYSTPSSTLAVDNSTFQNNQADDFGGAIASFQGNVSVTNSTFANNQADNGGGLHHNDGSLAIADSQFLNNQAQVDGGAIDLDNLSNSNITQTLIQGNQAILDSGGGISIANMTNLDLQQVTLFQNQATRRGGAIAAQSSQNFSGIINISDSTIDQNQAVDNGGGIQFNAVASGGTLNISNSTLSNNRANNGGAMRVGDNGTVTLQNVTISGNQSNQDGAGLYSDGIADISQVTIANNVSDADNNGSGQGGGIFRRAGTIRLGNTIVANNQAVTGADLAGTFVDQGNNLIGISDGSSGFTNSTLVGTSAAPINPLLAPLGDYGGLTQTIALLPGSAAIDAGNSAIPTDQRGIGRVGAPDIGAFESRGFLINARGITSQTSGSNPTTHQLRLGIGSAFGEPVNGGQILFSAPTTGPSVILSPNPTPITIAGNSASISLTSNGITGNYDVVATANGMPNALFSLVNSVSPVPPPVPPIPPVQPPVPPVPPVVMPPLPEPLPEPLPGPVPAEPPLAEPEPPAFPSFAERPMDVPKPELPGSPFPSSAEDAPLSMVDGSAIQAIDGIFSGEYVSYWQEGATEGSPIAQAIADSGSNPGASVAETAELLRKATATHGVNSAVVYALFVPQDKAADEGFGAVQVANMALTRRLETEEERDDDQLLLVLLPASGEAVSQLVDATRQEVMQQGRLFRMAVSDPEDNQSYRPLAQQLANWLVAPIEPDLERLELDNVMYALAPGLRSIPLTAMMDGDDYVIERYGLSLIPSVDLLETNFGVSPPTTQTLAAGANEFEQLADLPAVEIELNAIASRRESVDVLFNEDFTQANLVETQTQSQAKMLHLATHAEFNAGDLGSSYLQFWDGRLTLDDISQLGWKELELLILSACQTAISSPEAELGFAGLAAAAGVESTIASLWSVSDIGTLALMSEFYGQLADEPLRFEALRQAQLAMMTGETAIANQTLRTGRGDIELPPDWPLPEQANFSHPFYWAGFTLVGNPWW